MGNQTLELLGLLSLIQTNTPVICDFRFLCSSGKLHNIYWELGTNVSGHPVSPSSSSTWTAWHWNMQPTGCPRTSVSNYQSTLQISQISEDIISCYSLSTKSMQHLWEWIKKAKHKMVPVYADQAYSTIIGTALSILKLSTRCKWVVIPCHSPLTPLKKSGRDTLTGGWLGPSTSMNTMEKRKISCTCQKLKPRLSNSQTGHKLSCVGNETKLDTNCNSATKRLTPILTWS